MSATEFDVFCYIFEDYCEFKDFLIQCQQFKPFFKKLTNNIQEIKDGIKCSHCSKKVEWNSSKKFLKTFQKLKEKNPLKPSKMHEFTNKTVLERAHPTIVQQDIYQRDKNKEDDIIELQEIIEQLNEKNKTLETENDKIEFDFVEMKQKCEILEKQLEDQEQLYRKEIERLNGMITSLNQQVLALIKEKENIEHIQKENIKCYHKLDSKKQDIEELKTEILQLKDRLCEEKKAYDKISEKLQENDKKHQKDLKFLKNDYETGKQTIESLKVTNDSLNENKISLNNTVLELRNMRKKTEINESELDQELSLWLKSKCEPTFLQFLRKDNKDYLRVKTGLQEVVDQLYVYEKRIKDQDNLIMIKKETDDKYRKELLKNDNLMKITKETDDKFTKELLKLEEEKSNLLNEKDKLKEEIKNLTVQLEGRDSNLIKHQKEIDDKVQKIRILDDKRKEFEEEKSNLLNEMDKMKEEIMKLTVQLKGKNSEISKQEKEIDDNVQKIRILNDEKKVFEEEKSNLLNEKDKMKEEIKNLTVQLDGRDSNIIKQQKEIDDKVQKIRILDDKRKEFEEEKERLGKRLERIKEERTTLNNLLEDKNTTIKKLEREIYDHVQLITASENKRKELDITVGELTKNACKISEDLSSKTKELNIRNGEVSSMQLKIGKLKQQIIQLEDENEKITVQYKNVCDQLQEWKCRQKEKRAMVLRGALKESGVSDSIISCINRMLVKQIRTRLTKNNIDLDIKTCQEQPPGLQDPMLVIGLKRGRVEHDIENSLKGVEVPKVSCCVYIHMISSKEKANEIVPTKLSRSDFPPVTDMVYDTTDGIFDCEMNQQALEMIAKLLAAKWA